MTTEVQLRSIIDHVGSLERQINDLEHRLSLSRRELRRMMKNQRLEEYSGVIYIATIASDQHETLRVLPRKTALQALSTEGEI